MIVPDTSAWIDLARGVEASHVRLLQKALGEHTVITTDVIIHEFLRGFRDDGDYAQAARMMSALKYLPFWGKRNMLRASDNYRLLRKRGVTLCKPNDVVIATFCLENDLPLLHHDRDFDYMEQYLGLKIAR
ncbi:MAG: PIN domain nuclease [Treponematales bacterium]